MTGQTSTTPFCAAIDWGTTNLRVWLLDRTGAVLGERASGEGMRACMPDRFETVMESHLAALGAAPDLPVIVAGMAGARGGWREAPYLTAPVGLYALHAGAVVVPHASRDVRILPGICQRLPGREDVMRGEETQLAGAVAGGLTDGLVCLPGTHSKWAAIEAGRLVSFTTFMTGELFAVIGGHTILKDTLGEGGFAPADPAFRGGVADMLAEGAALTGRLFSLRAASLLLGPAAPDPRARLSGLLIGAEIAAARAAQGLDREVGLVASGLQAELYGTALDLAGFRCQTLDGAALVRRGLHDAARALWG
ncbi:2-dehydro-3-deoxygalactonokinase [Aquibium sp. ELW1220]|uniref:2-dehydro-3-deoxygalactonokinase n=1 Tax=Aquibium sp. ELW1220 TaxID=2976766 RepID=UPI0025B268F5|nr:2-dehydro-3-deoxygalactonokinase [Aquibium sp. ELW1220]MDN2584181.1 2-dehydro-3-deoxygalactonokinase [Aquibium sp. ELW1220]